LSTATFFSKSASLRNSAATGCSKFRWRSWATLSAMGLSRGSHVFGVGATVVVVEVVFAPATAAPGARASAPRMSEMTRRRAEQRERSRRTAVLRLIERSKLAVVRHPAPSPRR
jgi:hypothetical protein